MIDWNAYRLRYDSMTFDEVVRFHDTVWEYHPDQRHYATERLEAFFDGQARRVIELGGWRGEAAAQILPRHPEIECWDNFELCRGAVESPVTDDSRYHAILPPTWEWDLPIKMYDTAVLAHVVEHLRARQVSQLIPWLSDAGVQRVYLESPLIDIGRSWRGSTSAHVLEVGWPALLQMFAEHGYRVSAEGLEPPNHRIAVLCK